MKRIQRDFSKHPEFMKQYFLEHTWCDSCNKDDLGMSSPQENEEDGLVFGEGTCNICGKRVRSEIKEIESS
jgi:hypothetical protein